MSMIEDIASEVRDHTFKCGSKISLAYDPKRLSKVVRCECGYECEVPFTAVLELKGVERAFSDFEVVIEALNHPSFREKRMEFIKKEQEEQKQLKNLERHKNNAIGSLEL